MKNKVINVLMADDHELIREGLRRIIDFEDDIKIVSESENGKKAIDMFNIYKPDVVLLDMKMPIMNGLETLKVLREKDGQVKIIMLTVEDDRKTIKEAINIGADGYILKESAGSEICDAIRSVYEGEKYIDKSLVSVLFSQFRNSNNEQNNILDSLTKRELEVLFYMSEGFNNREIGRKLYLSEKTVKNYASNLFRKIDAHDRVKATIIAIENNIKEYYKDKYQYK